MKVSNRASSLTPSMTLAISAKAKLLKSQGVDVIGMGAGEPDFDTPDNIKQAAKDAIDNGFTKYTPAPGIAELRTAVADYYKKNFGLPYEMDNVIISVGGKDICYNLMQALIDPGDEVLIITPYWVSYVPMTTLAGGVPVFIETSIETDFLADATEIEKKVTDKTKLLILNSPSNPTGAAYSIDQLREIGELACARDFFVMSDEIYRRIVYDDFKFSPFPALDERFAQRCLIADGFSKTYSMTGWRAGWGVGPVDVIKAMTKIQSHSTSGTSSITQKAALQAISVDQPELDVMVKAFAKRRDIIVSRLNAMPGVECYNPKGAFYAFPKVSDYFGKSFNGKVMDGSIALCEYFLDEAKVAMVPGAAFGADDYVRLSYATDEQSIVKALDRMEEALGKLS